MWHEILDRNIFISNLYNEVPQLKDVRIIAIKIDDEGRRVSINFNMPKFADNPPLKWKNQNYNTVFVELDFFDVQEFSMNSSDKIYRGDINMKSDTDGNSEVNITGSLNLKLKAGYGMIQSVSGYIDTLE